MLVLMQAASTGLASQRRPMVVMRVTIIQKIVAPAVARQCGRRDAAVPGRHMRVCPGM